VLGGPGTYPEPEVYVLESPEVLGGPGTYPEPEMYVLEEP